MEMDGVTGLDFKKQHSLKQQPLPLYFSGINIECLRNQIHRHRLTKAPVSTQKGKPISKILILEPDNLHK